MNKGGRYVRGRWGWTRQQTTHVTSGRWSLFSNSIDGRASATSCCETDGNVRNSRPGNGLKTDIFVAKYELIFKLLQVGTTRICIRFCRVFDYMPHTCNTHIHMHTRTRTYIHKRSDKLATIRIVNRGSELTTARKSRRRFSTVRAYFMGIDWGLCLVREVAENRLFAVAETPYPYGLVHI